MNFKKILFFLIILSNNSIFSQNFNEIIQKAKVNNFSFFDNLNSTANLSESEKKYLIFQKELQKKGYKYKAKKKDTTFILKTTRDSIIKNLIIGDINLFNEFPNDSLSFNFYNLSLEKSLIINDTILITESLKKIFIQLFKSRKALNLLPSFLNIYSEYCYDNNEKSTYIFYNQITKLNENNIDKNILEFQNGLKLLANTENDFLKGKYNQILGICFDYFKKDKERALQLYFKASEYLSKYQTSLFSVELFGVYTNIAACYNDMGKSDLAETYYNKAYTIDIPKYRYIEKVKQSMLLSQILYEKKDYEKSIKYLKDSNKYQDTLNEYNKAIALNEIDTKYKTADKENKILQLEKENLEAETKRLQNRNLLFISILILFLGSVIAFLLLKNSKRKRILAQQQKEIETQKNLTLLKEQEITTINAMVDGQEKERKQIAEDLHDNLGSVLATLKLHFDNLKINQDKRKINQEELFNKTENLIDEAYLKVRSIAHAKNAGVIANQGLLIAIKMMAEKISSADKITIQVIDFGLNKRLENSLELTIFRIIQELTTNVLKHAEAKNITINISQFNNVLNIIIQDDGKGFDINKVDFKNGMGLSSIKTRIKHLKGTFEIDATIGKGSSIILNIPVV